MADAISGLFGVGPPFRRYPRKCGADVEFVPLSLPEKNGFPGLLEAVNKALELTGGKDTKIVGVTGAGHLEAYWGSYDSSGRR